MKKIKTELIKLVVVIVIVNAIALIGTVYLQNKLIGSTISYGIGKQQVITIEEGNTKEISSETCTDDGCQEVVEVSAKKVLLSPYLIFVFCVTLSLIYGIYKVRIIINQIQLFKDTSNDSLNDLQQNIIDYDYCELNEINKILNDSILRIKNSQRLEKELINFTMHDIKTPLQIIQGNIDLLKLETNDIEQVKRIENKLQDLNKLIESEVSDFEFTDVNITFLMEELVNDYRLIYPNIEFKITLNQGVTWNVNAITFKRIITNIIDNAIKDISIDREIIIIIEDKKIEIKNSTLLVKKINFSELLNASKGRGLKIIDKYIKLNNLQINAEVSEGYINFAISKND